MPTTYLLLRNNKQVGPLTLEALLQHNLQPHDLIWVEGRSAGWAYPSEIETLKPYLAQKVETVTGVSAKRGEPERPPQNTASKTTRNAVHIYVSLPAGVPPRTEEAKAGSLEEKAEALYQRVQAFAAGKTAEESDIHYARSLDDMKQQYSTWLVDQREKKKQGATKRKLLIAGAVLAITTTSFGISKWISNKTPVPQRAVATYASQTATPAPVKQVAMASVALPDSVSANPETLTTNEAARKESNTTLRVPERKNKVSKPITPLPLQKDSTKAVMQVAAAKPPVQPEVKKLIPLSQLLSLSNNFQYDKNGHTIHATQLSLQNNSSETLRSVAVAITYFKKEDRKLGSETVYFYNVQPGAASTITTECNRKATSARFEIGAITRADGSLYFIH